MKIKRKGFTLLEVIVAVTSFFLLLTVSISIYNKMIKLKYTIQAKINIIQDAYTVIEKINLLLKEYTIDYEEYFNRKNVGCDTYTEPFQRNTQENGYCDRFTAYGNSSSINNNESNTHTRYFCSSILNESFPHQVIYSPGIQYGSGCLNTGKQAFGQYYRQFWNVKRDVDNIPGARNDDDDEYVMKGPTAIEDSNNIQELYLISQNKTSRILIRRTLVESGDRNNDGIISGANEKLYTLEILKLRGFDAGNNHDFNIATSSGVYDGKIDTRACDIAQGFLCHGKEIHPTLYSGYRLPINENDGRVKLFQKNITISDRNIKISPNKHPEYAGTENNVQINPYFTISFTSKPYGKIRQKKLGTQYIDTFQVNLQTTFNTKNFYTK